MEEKNTTIELDISLYLKKINIFCPSCAYNCECRGPAPHDSECPKDFKFIPVIENLNFIIRK